MSFQDSSFRIAQYSLVVIFKCIRSQNHFSPLTTGINFLASIHTKIHHDRQVKYLPSESGQDLKEIDSKGQTTIFIHRKFVVNCILIASS